MESNLVNSAASFLIGPLVLAALFSLVFLSVGPIQAQNEYSSTDSIDSSSANFSDSVAAGTLCSAGLGDCQNVASRPKPNGGLLSQIFGGVGITQRDPIISVVGVPGQTAVFRIINGQKHLIPTEEIFESYGFSSEIIQPIAQTELDKYPIARLFMVEGDETFQAYYLTEGGMIRPILNDVVFYSYGNRKEDLITINQKEFNYYPRSQFVYLERPEVNRDVYQITGGIKRYLTPVAVRRMNLNENEIAPINQVEFDQYSEGEAVIY